MNLKQLKAYCRQNEIHGYSSLRRQEIIDLIQGNYRKKEYVLNLNELSSRAVLQKKTTDELKFICKALHINIYRKPKSSIIELILQHKTITTTTITPMQRCDTDSADEKEMEFLTDESSSSEFYVAFTAAHKYMTM